MQPSRWHGSPVTLLLASLVLPPLGLIILWVRPKRGVVWKLAGSLVLAVWAVVYLYLFFGLRMEVDGSAVRPIFSFYKPESHYAALERSREISEEPPTPAQSSTTASARQRSTYWTNFRGPHRDGRYDETQIHTGWPRDGLRLLWRQPVGGGYASFVVAEGRAFTIEQRRNQEVVSAYDLETGRELWTHSWTAEFHERMGGDGPRATPTWDQDRLYALGATGEFQCLKTETGRLIWAKNILKDNSAPNLPWGMAASPLVIDEKVIVLPGGSNGNSIVAYDKRSGEPVWKSLNDKQAYTSPMLVVLAGKRQILIVSALRALGLALEDGSLLWDYPWRTAYEINAAQPLMIDENRFFISAGYGHGAAVVEVTRSNGDFSARTVWENLKMKNKFSSSVLYQDHIYGLDERILTCVDVATGERRWKGGRYSYGQILLASEHLIVLTEQGDLVLVKATPEAHQELARFSALTGKTWNHPALARGRLLVRNTTEMACFDITPS